MIRAALVSGVMVFSICATSLVLLLGYFLSLSFVDMNYDDYRGAERQAVIDAVNGMHRREQDGLGTYRVTTWRVTSVEKCRTGCPRPYAVELELFTLFGIPYGKTGVGCGRPGTEGGEDRS